MTEFTILFLPLCTLINNLGWQANLSKVTHLQCSVCFDFQYFFHYGTGKHALGKALTNQHKEYHKLTQPPSMLFVQLYSQHNEVPSKWERNDWEMQKFRHLWFWILCATVKAERILTLMDMSRQWRSNSFCLSLNYHFLWHSVIFLVAYLGSLYLYNDKRMWQKKSLMT